MNKKGFTLVELMVVIVIIGILAAVAAPKLSDNINAARCNEVPKKFKEIMDKAVEYEAAEGSWPAITDIDVNITSQFWAYTVNTAGTNTGSGDFEIVATTTSDLGDAVTGSVVAVNNDGQKVYTASRGLDDKYMRAYLQGATSI